MADLAQGYQVHPNQIYAWKKQLQEQAARVLESGNGDVVGNREREIERFHAKIGELIVVQARCTVDPPAMRVARHCALRRLPTNHRTSIV